MSQIYTILVLITTVQCTPYMRPYQQLAPVVTCSHSNHSALTERFLDMVFSDSHPPVCVCVQMCADYPMYCYPDGCLKRTDHKKQKGPDIRHKLPSSNMAPSIMEAHVGLLNSFFDNSRPETGLVSTLRSSEEIIDSVQFHRTNVLPNPFKDKYTSLFKFRKTPKVHIRYNLREQSRNPKSDVINIQNIDVEKPKWHSTSGQYLFDSLGLPQTHNKGTGVSDSESEQSQLKYSKYFKRDLNGLKSISAVKTDQTVDEREDHTQNNPFSLENLIENLIESSFGPLLHDTEIHLNVNVDHMINKNLTKKVHDTNTINKNSTLNKNSTQTRNDTENVVSLNMWNDIIHQKIYEQEPKESNTTIYNDMIGHLMKRIDKQNNNSMEAIKLSLGRKFNDTDSESTVYLTSKLITDTVTRTTTVTDAGPKVTKNPLIAVHSNSETKEIKPLSKNDGLPYSYFITKLQ